MRANHASQAGYNTHSSCPGGEIGRHNGLKIRRFVNSGRTGSIPVPGTTVFCAMLAIAGLVLGTLFLVRHGQASFGAADYDQLSPLGQQQSLRLGEYWRSKGMQFDAVLVGTLLRHRQTWQGIANGLYLSAEQLQSPGFVTDWPGLNEYDSHALIEAIHPAPLATPDTPELYRHHFRLLRDSLQAWMLGQTAPRGMPSYAEFVAGVTGALDHVRSEHSKAAERKVLIVSSGGPISTAVGHVLGTSANTTIELNLRIRNSSVTEFAYTPKRHMLVTYNTLPHLDADEHASWLTYS
jgi:broad specificity phosphatase PhoE